MLLARRSACLIAYSKAASARSSVVRPAPLAPGLLIFSEATLDVSPRAIKRGRFCTAATKKPAEAAASPMATPPAASPNGRARALQMLDFINASWTQFHAVEEASKRLLAAGFQHIQERDAWSLKPGGKYFFTRNMSTLVAFAVGASYKPGNGFYMVGAHTDSPCLKLKPVSKGVKSGFLMVNVECYGGGLWYTWFDRDLSVAGRVLIRGAGGKLMQRLVKIDRPILRIPMLAIHLQRDLYTQGFKPNFQTNLVPILATSIKGQLGADAAAATSTAAVAAPAADADAGASGAAGSEQQQQQQQPAATAATQDDQSSKHHAVLLQLLAEQLGCSAADIVDFELNVCDVQPGQLGGIRDEFVNVGRLDNLASCYCSLTALIDSCSAPNSLAEEIAVRAIALFDHEEVGSDSAQGAGSPVMRDTITRVTRALSGAEVDAVERAFRQSFLVSADMAHALHPNYADKHDPEHQPKFHGGLVIKYNHNQRYATNAVSNVLFREVARAAGVPCQEFAVRNDTPCGSTIGPILASALGCRTIDVGMAQLAMHSIREMCGTEDVTHAYRHFLAFFNNFTAIDASLELDSLPPPDIKGTIQEVPCGHSS